MDLLVIAEDNTVMASNTVEECILVSKAKHVLILLKNSVMQIQKNFESLSHKVQRDICTSLSKLFSTAYIEVSTM